MTWSRWYATKSYMMSTLWLSPLIACVLAQLTYRVPYVLGIDLGAIPGFIYTEQGQISALARISHTTQSSGLLCNSMSLIRYLGRTHGNESEGRKTDCFLPDMNRILVAL